MPQTSGLQNIQTKEWENWSTDHSTIIAGDFNVLPSVMCRKTRQKISNKTEAMNNSINQLEEGNRGWDGWLASQIHWARTWANSLGDGEGREAWCVALHGVTKSQTKLGNWTTTTSTQLNRRIHISQVQMKYFEG